MSRGKLLLAALAISVACAAYTYKHRYYLRFIPIPLSFADVVNKGSWLLPAHEAATPKGSLNFGNYDLRTEKGLRQTLNAIQDLSPNDNVSEMPSYENITFEKWVKEITTKPFFCTDATQLFILAAWQQGLRAREWHLLPPGWPSGSGHSVAEYFNPETGRWQLVDGQHAAIVRDKDGAILDMTSVIRAYKENGGSNVRIDYGPYQDMMRQGARGGSTESHFFKNGLMRTPVLQLRQSTWFATVARRFGLSGHFVIGYPILVDGWTHDYRVWVTKVTALGTVIFGLIAGAAFAFHRKRIVSVKSVTHS